MLYAKYRPVTLSANMAEIAAVLAKPRSPRRAAKKAEKIAAFKGFFVAGSIFLIM